MRNHGLKRCIAGLALASTLLSGLAPRLALATEDAAAWAKKGAQSFKVNDYYEAAVAFEKASQLDPRQPKNLRYAGRAWQQVGHWKKALILLELYVKIEPSAEHRASIAEFLEPLRASTPRQRAEALQQALIHYPQARLEAEAAAALEEVGDEAACKTASELWEIARVRAASDDDRRAADAGARRAQERWHTLRQAREDGEKRNNPARRAGAADPTPGSGSAKAAIGASTGSGGAAQRADNASSWRVPLLVAGAVVGVGGAVTAGLGYAGAREVDNTAASGGYTKTYSTYVADRDRNLTMQYLGWGAVGLGAGLAIWGLLSPPGASPAVTFVPDASGRSTGLAVVGSF